MCGRAAVIRGGVALARVAGARRVIHAHGPRPGGAAARGGGAAAGGAFRDGGRAAPRPDMRYDDAPAPSTAAADPSSSSSSLSPSAHTKPVSTFDSPTKMKQESGTLIKDEPFSAEGETLIDPFDSSKKSTKGTTTTTTSTTSSANFNCGPTSTMPIWRIQTVEEQRELLALDRAVKDTQVKAEVEDILGTTDPTSVKTEKMQPIPVIQFMTFGFNHPLAGRRGQDGSTIGDLIFNARSETIQEKTMWRTLIEKKRCVVMVDGFYEFKTEYSNKTGDATGKQAYFFHMPIDGKRDLPDVDVNKKGAIEESPFPVMYLAAVYDASIDDATGVTTYSFCILTGGPSKEMAQIHNRQPIVLTHEDAQKWVDVEQYSFDRVKHLLKPYEGLCFYKTPNVVNNSRNHGIECIEPLEKYEKRMEAKRKKEGLGRFFTAVPKKSPQSASTSSSSPTPSSEIHAAAVVSEVADADIDSFFNTKGAPGRVFPQARVNPADPGNLNPVPDTSNAADLVESFVQRKLSETQPNQQKDEVKQEESKTADDDVEMKSSNKRKSSEPTLADTSSSSPQLSPDSEHNSKRHKLTATERARIAQQQQA